MKNSTLVHIERGDEWLMMHRVKKENDLNKDKWIGLGGKFEDGESPEECAVRECREEAGIIMLDYKYRGIVTFVSDIYETEYMHLFTCDRFTFENENCENCENCEDLDNHDEKENMKNCNLQPRDSAVLKDCTDNPNSSDVPSINGAPSNTDISNTTDISGNSVISSSNDIPLPDCDEGELAWIKKSEFYKLQQWEGDKLFLDLLEKEEPFFSMKLKYEGDTLIYAALNGKQIR